MFWRDAGFQQVIQGRSQGGGRGAVGLLFGQGICHEAEGALDLAVGELVRAAVPVFGHAEPGLVRAGQRGQRGVHLGQVRGPAVIQGEHHPGQ
jgi:hypothetical protein